MKKVFLSLMLIFLCANVSFAQGFNKDFLKKINTDFFSKLKNQPTAQERLAPVKQTYGDEPTTSEKAIILYNENDVENAFKMLISIKESERTAQDWVLLGNILQDQEKMSDAVFMYQRAINVDPKFYKSYYNLANIYLEQDKYYMAIENYKKASKCNPEFPYSYYNTGCAYLKLGNLKKAKLYFLKAIALKNTEPDFHYNLAYTYKKLNKEALSKQYLGFYNKLMENNQ